MPGIFGLVDKVGSGGTFHAEAMDTMASVMRYEPFYTSKQYDCEELGVFVGWVGPIQNSVLSYPIVDRQDGISLFISGEAYCETSGEGQIDQRLFQVVGESLRIISLYKRKGDRFPEKINGLFSGFLVDKRREKCFLFNDRFGIERLFLYEDNERIAFSSEAKAILAVFPETRSFDPEGLGQLLACGCTLGETSLFQKIKVLPGGSVMKFAKGQTPQFKKYFDYSLLEELEPLSEKEFLKRFCETLKIVVKSYSLPSSRAAVSLTGGLDSRMIMACLQGSGTTVPCYTFGSMYRETYDVLTARKVAEHCRQPHEVIVLGEEFLVSFENYLKKAVLISDGYLGFSGAAELYLNNLARGVSPVRITGNYGGELLRGFRAFKCSIPKGEFLRPEMLEFVKGATRLFSRMGQMRPISFTLFNQAPSGYGRYAIERSQVRVRSPFLNNNLVELIYRMPAGLGAGNDPSAAVINECYPELLAIPTDRGLLGVESRLARTARRVYREAIFKLEYWTGHGMPTTLARVSRCGLGAVFERLFTGRHKFQHFRRWTQKELASYAGTVILRDFGRHLDECIDFAQVKIMLAEHQAGKQNFTEEIDKLMTIVLADRLLLRNE